MFKKIFNRLFNGKRVAEYRRELLDLAGEGLILDELEAEVAFLLAKYQLRTEHVASVHREVFEQYFYDCYRDAVLDDKEQNDLNRLLTVFELPQKTLTDLLAVQFMKKVSDISADRRLTAAEEQELAQTAEHLGLNQQQVDNILVPQRAELTLFRLLSRLESESLPVIDPPGGFVKKKRESVHWIVPDVIFFEERMQTSYSGVSQGVSFRIAKGVSYRVGGHRGNIRRTPQMTEIDRGRLVITDERIIFLGTRRRQISEFKKLVEFQLFSDGLQISVENRQKSALYQFSPAYSEIVGLLISRIVEERE